MDVRRIARQVQGALRNFLVFCGVDQYKRREDRRVLEQVIFPYFLQRPEFARVPFVGFGWYTKVYNKMFCGKDYWTLEVNPALRKYGARQHITDSVENVHLQFREGGLDLIICNGVFGWGLNARDEVDAAFAACFTYLRENGLLIVGWDDVPEHRPFPLEESLSLAAFSAYDFPPFNTSQYLTTDANRHTYNFYIKAGWPGVFPSSA